MKIIARGCCLVAALACLFLANSRAFSDVLSSETDYSLLTKGSDEDRKLLKNLNEIIEKANTDRDVVKNWHDEYVKQERKTYARVIDLFAKFEKSEQKKLAQDLKKGELSEAFQNRPDAKNLLIYFQRLESDRTYIKKLQTLYDRLEGKIQEAESARDMIAHRMISDVPIDDLREKEKTVKELSSFLVDVRNALDAWKENDRKQKESLIDAIVEDSKTRRKDKRSKDDRSNAEEGAANDSVKNAKEEIGEDRQTEQETVWTKVEEENAPNEQGIDLTKVEEENAPDEQGIDLTNVEEENTPDAQGIDLTNVEEENAPNQQATVLTNVDEENAPDLQEISCAKTDESAFPAVQEIDLPKIDEATTPDKQEIDSVEKTREEVGEYEKDEPKEEEKEDSLPKEPNAGEEGTWTRVLQIVDAGSDSAVSKKSKHVIKGVDLKQAVKSVASTAKEKPISPLTKKSSDRRQVLTIRNVEFAFRFCPSSDQDADEGFWIQETETTQEQWFAVGVQTVKPCYFKGAKLPVENVDWKSCSGFVKKLNESNVAPEGWTFTLPTKAQWERAWKLGKSADDVASLVEYAWFGENSGERTHEVATKKPDALGLYDMSGNVWEWTRSTDATGKALVVRGASWKNLPENGALVDSFNCAAQTCGNNLGLRLVLVRKPLVAAPNTRKILR